MNWRSKNEIIQKLNTIANEQNSKDNGFKLTVECNDWQNYGKDRTYFQIVETRENSKHYKVKKYGYYDNASYRFVGDVEMFNYTFSGAKLA